jgi:hypothetical protein
MRRPATDQPHRWPVLQAPAPIALRLSIRRIYREALFSLLVDFEAVGDRWIVALNNVNRPSSPLCLWRRSTHRTQPHRPPMLCSSSSRRPRVMPSIRSAARPQQSTCAFRRSWDEKDAIASNAVLNAIDADPPFIFAPIDLHSAAPRALIGRVRGRSLICGRTSLAKRVMLATVRL